MEWLVGIFLVVVILQIANTVLDILHRRIDRRLHRLIDWRLDNLERRVAALETALKAVA